MSAVPDILPDDVLFPDSDGQPMADNTEQFRWIVTIKENLEILFAQDPLVFVAGDLLWYPVRSPLLPPTAPDVLVVFGRPKGRRGSYRQWQEDNIAPQVVFEVLSPSNTRTELERKFQFYETYGIEEYYIYDPDTFDLRGWQRQGDYLMRLPQLHGYRSPRLGIQFQTDSGELQIYRPDGRRFLTPVELNEQFEQEQQRAEQERQRAEQERQRAEQEYQRAEQERQRAERMAAYLRSLGVDPDNLPST